VLTFLALSFSKYKLPHYIFVTFPFAAIIAANYLLSLQKKTMLFVQAFFNVLFWFICALGMIYVFPTDNIFLGIILVLLCAVSWTVFFKGKSISSRIFYSAVVTSIGFNLMMAAHFYPNLISGYQAPGKAGELARTNNKGEGQFYYYSSHSHSLNFYYHNLVPKVPNLFKNMDKGDWVYTDQVGKDYVETNNLDFSIAHKIPSYRVTILTMDFIRPETRANVVDTMYIFEKN
jgi:hypothetical protein